MNGPESIDAAHAGIPQSSDWNAPAAQRHRRIPTKIKSFPRKEKMFKYSFPAAAKIDQFCNLILGFRQAGLPLPFGRDRWTGAE